MTDDQLQVILGVNAKIGRRRKNRKFVKVLVPDNDVGRVLKLESVSGYNGFVWKNGGALRARFTVRRLSLPPVGIATKRPKNKHGLLWSFLMPKQPARVIGVILASRSSHHF